MSTEYILCKINQNKYLYTPTQPKKITLPLQFCVLFPEVISYPSVPQKEPQVTSEVSWVLYISFSCFSLGLYHKVTSLINLLFTFEHSKLYISKIILWVFFYSYFINIYSWESSKSLHATVIPAFLLLYSITLHKKYQYINLFYYWWTLACFQFLLLPSVTNNSAQLSWLTYAGVPNGCMYTCVCTHHAWNVKIICYTLL